MSTASSPAPLVVPFRDRVLPTMPLGPEMSRWSLVATPTQLQTGRVQPDLVTSSDQEPVANPDPTGSSVELRNVTKRYRVGDSDIVALEDVDLSVDESAFVVILGPSGCGKTTLLNMIGALDTPTSGSVRVGGLELTGASRAQRAEVRRRSVSFIFQSFNLFPGLTAFENVRFGADAARRPDAGDRAAEALMSVGLTERFRHFPHQLSGGEQQRVAIARALATGNPILLADEPTGELDFRTGVSILGVLQEQARAGKSVLVVTHNREISRIADRVIELSSGHIVSDGPPLTGKAEIDDLQW